VTATPILETLAREFSAGPDHVQSALEMLDAGLCAPFIGRFRRTQVGPLTESAIRRLDRRRKELEELDRRRATILALLEREPHADPTTAAAVRSCMDRFELEDLFIPHRRPEPEVQLALDRGLGGLADLLVAPLSPEERKALGVAEEPPAESEPAEPAPPAPAEVQEEAVPEAPQDVAATTAEASAEASAAESAPEPTADPAPVAAEEEEIEEAPAPLPQVHAIDVKTAMNVHLARLCAPFVNPDRGVHTEAEALSGAVRILSDRLGRNARLRGAVRRLLAKQGVLTVRATMEESRLGRHKPLLKIRAPLRQLQGHRLLAIRQAQKERVLHTVISLDPAVALPKVRAALGRHTHPGHEELLRELALQALNQRLLPMVEPDVRLELKERADAEALRFLAQHLRQILYTAPLGPQTVAGLDVNAKGDWLLVVVDAGGEALPGETKIEVGTKEPAALGAELRAALESHRVRAVGVGNGKLARTAVPKIRAALRAARVLPSGTDGQTPGAAPASAGGAWQEPFVFIVDEAGLSSYANSELARAELADRGIPARMAISLGRRLQDPMAEILKVDPRHLGLGSEQGLVSKANARRVFLDTIESAVAHVGCDLNRATPTVLEMVPGLDRASVRGILERRKQGAIRTREELRSEGLLSEAQWTSAAAFLRVPGSPEPLDATGLHPEQYPLVRRILDSGGTTVDQALGRFGSTRGLRREDFDVDEPTWRDLMREISWPGRDPRPRQHFPALLEPDTDPIRLVKERVVEGVVTNVASFGVFVDVGLPSDAMVHISEISERYVRDARELLSIGQVVRARILDAGGQRLTLSLRGVPMPQREPRPDSGPRRGRDDRPRGPGGPRRTGEGARGHGGRGGDARRGAGDREPGPPPNVRAAQTRRDGLGARSARRGGGRGSDRGGRGPDRGGQGPGRMGQGPGGMGHGPGRMGHGPGRPARSGGRDDRGGRDGGMDRDERVNLESINRSKSAFSPFASFFKSMKPEEKGESEDGG
jgi:uncharacterized protein